ncbi:hypothetical protein IGS61_12245 [Janthinobacterium sp. FW305-129]|uniref:DUF6702 family protein n=1 Tax=Janthinobacterium sp. FW305-129 TaxID=2775054 RepID=UPI001E63953B|nr:DUF6702 family protein [Janthinobacterium sp. FW305-129]MCC7598262.1 hypothetical protein [Janthinobacterium sp. FW305-129]
MKRWRLLAASLLACASMAAGAHNFHMGIADISYNGASGSTEVVHTYTGHDVEALLTNLYQRQFDLGQEDSEAALRRYVEKQFYLVGPDGKRLRLNWVGMKVNADNVVIFQEIEHTRLVPATRIHNQLLIDFLPSQRNTLNVQDSGSIQTLIFDRQNTELPIRQAPVHP